MKACTRCKSKVDTAAKVCMECGTYVRDNSIEVAVMSSSPKQLSILDSSKFRIESELLTQWSRSILILGLLYFGGALFFLVRFVGEHGAFAREPELLAAVGRYVQIVIAGIVFTMCGVGLKRRYRWAFFLGLLLTLLTTASMISVDRAPALRYVVMDHAQNIVTILSSLSGMLGFSTLPRVPHELSIAVNSIIAFLMFALLIKPRHLKEFFGAH